MSQVWVTIFVIMIAGSILKNIFINMFIFVAIDVIVLAVCYFVLRRYPYIDLAKSMVFLVGLTVINILTDIQLISSLFGSILLLVLLVWTMFGDRFQSSSRRPSKLRHKWHK
jgi:hypothetical protein